MKLGLQIVLGVLSLIPLAFAVMGLWFGAAYFLPAGEVPAPLDNQLRYLSGVYLLVSLLLWWAIPNVERHGRLLGFICLALVVGGIGRVISWLTLGPGDPGQIAGMGIELGSPLLLLWQRAIAVRDPARLARD